MDSTAMFYAQPSNMSAHPLYQKTQIKQRGGFSAMDLQRGKLPYFIPSWLTSKKKFKSQMSDGIAQGLIELLLPIS